MLEHGRAIIPVDACHHLIFIVVEVPFSFQLCIRRGLAVWLGRVAGDSGGQHARQYNALSSDGTCAV